MSKRIYALLGIAAILSIPMNALAANGKIDTGDTTFVFIAAAMVFLMIPGLAMFYGGMARKKNALNTMMMSFILMSVIAIQWIFFGFSAAFGTDIGHVIGGLNFAGFAGVGGAANPTYAGTIPFALFAMYQMMFAIITPALISGAVAGRMRFPAFVAFGLIWSMLVYDPLAHWVWGANGWMKNLGVLDFAGGIVVHISAGVAALVAVLVLGRAQRLQGKEFFAAQHPADAHRRGAAMVRLVWL